MGSIIEHNVPPPLADPSLFVYKHCACLLYLLIYVDDIILTGNSAATYHKFITILYTEFAIKDLGKLSYFLGLEVNQFLHALTYDQLQVVKPILRYDKGTITYDLSFHQAIKPSVLGYSDANWARYIETQRSTYGYSFSPYYCSL
ncbi:uncharacterized mitochondrial protein AtMg00810-like [Rutidosis leptorrhynchoides]|uniref:uncharacterized mitochondrial protein AtMg00810-like n=1 Tax=Rutidosis leptorrhynchoides TaxID=125765 RepID=UPI003A99B41D